MKQRPRRAAGALIVFSIVCVCIMIVSHNTKKAAGRIVNHISESTETDAPVCSPISADEATAIPMVTPTVAPLPVETPEPLATTRVKIGNRIKIVYEVKGKFEKKNNRLLYRMDSGKTFRKGFFLKGHHVYFARKNAEIVRGWFRYRGNIYFFNRKKGQLSHKSRVEGVKLGKYGIAKTGTLNRERADTYLKAVKTLRKITRVSDKKSVKLYKCYKWVMQYGYVRHRTMKQMMQQSNWRKTWDIVFANDIFDRHSGCCVSDAAAFALLAKECGYKKVTLCCDTGHAWDDIGGRLYDPLFAKARDFNRNYHARYTDYRINPAITKKIS